MNQTASKWIVLLTLSIVWGSSFILMKLSLRSLDPIQVGSLRMIISSLFLMVFAGYKIKLIQKRHWRYLLYNSLLGTFFPVFLFSYAVLHIDGGIVAILNSLTPLNTLLFGFLFFGFDFSKRQLTGIVIGMMATIFLISRSADLNPNDNYWYAILVIIATIGYAFNVNILKKHLNDLDSTAIAVGNYLIILIPAILVLILTGFFKSDFTSEATLTALGYMSILAIIGTALSSIFFAQLIKISNPIFASSVTYLIPIVAILWGTVFGEKVYFSQILAGIVILVAVYLVNRKM
jgi:drug/metabolite transporter (DMT)-like permease